MLASVASSTTANRLKRKLNELGIFSSVIQTPQALTKEGCGYSLRFDDDVKMYVEKTAVELGINIRAFYRESHDGEKREYFKV